MKASMVAAALVGSVAASQHKAHADFHRRGEYKVDDVCSTVYHTVYVTASPMPSMAPNTTVVAKPSSTPCEEKKTSVYTPIVVSSTKEVPIPSKEVPVPSKEAYPPAPPKQESSKPPVYPVYTPAPSPSKPAASPSKPAEYPAVPASSKAVEYPVVPAPSKPAETQPKPVPSKQADKPKPGGSYSQSGRIVTKGDKWAMTYTPYATNGNCKTSSEIASDIKKIAELGFTTIRSYSTDCGVFESVVPECQKNGLKVIYGIFLEGAGKGPFSDYANQQLQEIKDKAPKDSVAMVIVGNECMFNNNCEATQLASYIDHVRKELQSCGFPSDVAVTTTEPVGTWEEKGAALCDHIDVFTVQVHPYFTSTVSADMAGDFALQQLAQAAKVCPGAASKGTYISEIGWPSAGDANGLAVPGVEQQKIAVKSIMEKVGSEACLFSFQDDAWKAPGSLNVEQHFGCTEALY